VPRAGETSSFVGAFGAAEQVEATAMRRGFCSGPRARIEQAMGLFANVNEITLGAPWQGYKATTSKVLEAFGNEGWNVVVTGPALTAPMPWPSRLG